MSFVEAPLLSDWSCVFIALHYVLVHVRVHVWGGGRACMLRKSCVCVLACALLLLLRLVELCCLWVTGPLV